LDKTSTELANYHHATLALTQTGKFPINCNILHSWFTIPYVLVGPINSPCINHIESASFLSSSSIIVSLCISLWKLWLQSHALGATRHQSGCSQCSWHTRLIRHSWQSGLVHWTFTRTLSLPPHILPRHNDGMWCAESGFFPWENSIPWCFSHWLPNANHTGLAPSA